MKTFLAVALFVCGLSLTVAASYVPTRILTTQAGPEVIKRGKALGDSATIKFADVLKEPEKHTGKSVIIEGVVLRVCKMEGCWMEIAPDEKSQSVRVTFKDHAFFVPKNVDKWEFRAEGEFTVKKLSKEEVDHLVNEDGAEIKRNPDGTANEITFVATGVELRQKVEVLM
jgi:hypothetical protein